MFNVRLEQTTNTVYVTYSRVAQWKRAGPITQRSEDRNLALLILFLKKDQGTLRTAHYLSVRGGGRRLKSRGGGHVNFHVAIRESPLTLTSQQGDHV